MFFPFIFATGSSEPILSSLQHAPFFVFMILFFYKHLSVAHWFYFCFASNIFLQSLKILHIYFANKNVLVMPEKMIIWEKNPGPSFMKMGYLLGGKIYFYIKRFWFFNIIRLQGESWLNRGKHFFKMFFSP